jgi:uncharacterized protein
MSQRKPNQMLQKLVGRQAEQEVLRKAYQSFDAELVAVFGRRRVGKTFLIRSVFAGKIELELNGAQNGTTASQLQHFTSRLNYHARPILPYVSPKNWQEAFQMLIIYLESLQRSEKMVIFLDEFPWLAGKKSDFLQAFGLFWNTWASQNNVMVIICGSAASWIINKVIRDRGGLHNRITRRIQLQPFNLHETEAFLQSRGVKLNRYHILQLYMAMGGIPHYLKEVEAGKTATQNIDQVCFSKQGLLREEFNELYPALFSNAESHIQVIRALANTWQGLTRGELVKIAELADGGNTTRTLEELEYSGFVSTYYAFGKKKKELRYRLSDEYSLFYLQFIAEKRAEGTGTWEKVAQTPVWKSWSGYAFESICLKHVPAIKKALGIAGIYTEASTFYLKNSDFGRGVQIDLLIDRNDQAINLFEIKFYQDRFALSKEQAEEIQLKKAIFKSSTNSNKQVFVTLLSSFALSPNENSLGALDNFLDMNCLFEPF